VLQLDRALDLIEADLLRLCEAAASLATAHRAAPMLGRTLLQPATPISFGLKAAQWLQSACDCRSRLRRAAGAALAVQFGGAAGSLGSLGDRAQPVAARLNALLAPKRAGAESGQPALPWHTRRGNLVALAAELGIATGACAKIARDVSLMMQFEVSEAMEPAEAGRGGSSAMPHKRNPVLCMLTLSAGLRAPQLVATLMCAMTQEHERALGGWQAEWTALPELVKLCGGALANMAETLAGLQVDVDRLRKNLDALRGLPMTEMASLALAGKIGRAEAHQLVEAAARKTAVNPDLALVDVLAAETRVAARFSRQEIDAMVDPASARGATEAFIDLALARWAQERSIQNG
jgi:3-carboxy-cis,cis-muconate cycloisomerase